MTREGCPVALLEAMCMSKACLVSDAPGNRDVIKNGINGLLFPACNSKVLHDKLKDLLNEALRHKLGVQARNTVLNNYGIEREVQAHDAFYQEVLKA